MKLTPLKANMTVLKLEDLPAHGTEVLFSYETPVAAYSPTQGWMQTDQKYSTTTTRHINQWAGKGAKFVPQQTITNLVK